MNELRVFMAVIMFTASSYFVYDLIVNGFNIAVLLFSVLGYVLAHYIWPRRFDDESAWYDFLELIVDLPFRTIAYLLRSLSRAFRGVDDGIDIDL